jgi:neutral ceramidase
MNAYRIGSAREDITPPVGMPCLGWRPRHLPFQGVHDPLFARAVFLEAGGGKVLILSTDTIGLADTVLGPGRSFLGEVKAGISRRTGIPGSHVLLGSNHIHSSAETIGFRPLAVAYPDADRWIGGLQKALVRCAVAACADPVEARLSIGQGTVSGLAYNRRGDGCLDQAVTVLLFESERGAELVLVNYACHPVILQVWPMVSADYVGAMVRQVEAAADGPRMCAMLMGACGDIDPVKVNSKDPADSEAMGGLLAGEVLRVVRSMRAARGPEEPAVIDAASVFVDLPSRPLPEADRLPPDRDNAEALARIAEGTGPFRGEVQALRIGNAVLVGLPGEIFCSTGVALKRMCGPLKGVPVGYANGYIGYFIPPAGWRKEGYETGLGPWSKTGPEAEGILLEAASGLLKAMRGAEGTRMP